MSAADRPTGLDLKVVLVSPEIPGNTGTIGRTCAALGLELILVRPYGFDLTEKSVRRAGLDYWKHVRLGEYDDWAAFRADRAPRADQVFFLEPWGARSFYEADYTRDAYLIFGCETKGLPAAVTAGREDRVFHLPMTGSHVRSLNLANAATAAVYQAARAFLS